MNRTLYLVGILALGSLTGSFAQAAHRYSTCDNATAAQAQALLGKIAADYQQANWGQFNADVAQIAPIRIALDADDALTLDVMTDSEADIPGAVDAKLGATPPPPPAPAPAPAPTPAPTPTPAAPGVVQPAVVTPAAPVLPAAVTLADKVALTLVTKLNADVAGKNRPVATTDKKHLGKIINSKRLSKLVRPVVEQTWKTADEYIGVPVKLLAKTKTELDNKNWTAAEANIATLKAMTDLTAPQKAELAKEEEFLAKHKK